MKLLAQTRPILISGLGARGVSLPFSLGVALLMAVSTGNARASTWDIGDVFAGVAGGSYKVYTNAGVFKETITDGLGGFTTGCAFNPAQDKLYTTNFSSDKVIVYNNAHPHTIAQTISSSPGSNESVVFAADGSFYVGHLGGIDHRKSDGTLLHFTPAGPNTDWIDLAKDQKTMFYDFESTSIRRINVATDTQLADFASLNSGSAFALRILPPGDGTGGLLVADGANVKKLDGAGAVVKTYTVAGEGSFFAFELDPNGTSFWSGNFSTGNFYRINIATGAVEIGPINTGTGGNTLFGLCVKGSLTVGAPTCGTKTDPGKVCAFVKPPDK